MKITVVVHGKPVTMTIDQRSPLRRLIDRALGKDERRFNLELTDAEGRELNLDRSPAELGLRDGTRLFLGSRVGFAA